LPLVPVATPDDDIATFYAPDSPITDLCQPVTQPRSRAINQFGETISEWLRSYDTQAFAEVRFGGPAATFSAVRLLTLYFITPLSGPFSKYGISKAFIQ
jgi:hypothetical protein